MSDRKIFPVEAVLALAVGKEGVDIKEVAGYVAGRSITCDCCASAVGPFAAAWLARWYPKFMEMGWKEDMSWESFVTRGKNVLGDHISLTPMDGRTKAMTAKALDCLVETYKSFNVQKSAAEDLAAKAGALAPAEARAEALQKKCDELEAKIKSMNTDLGGLRKQVAEYQGKVAVSHDDLMKNIKDAIKDGLKGLVVVGGAAAGAAMAAGAEEAAPAEENAVPDDFGFGTSGASVDGFGF